jgi:hypothetical protein
MKIATFNINNVNKRLDNLMRWLREARSDVVCLQELKATDPEFPVAAIDSPPASVPHGLVGSGWSMSALPPKADIRQRIEHVCFVPLGDIGMSLTCRERTKSPGVGRREDGQGRGCRGLGLPRKLNTGARQPDAEVIAPRSG